MPRAPSDQGLLNFSQKLIFPFLTHTHTHADHTDQKSFLSCFLIFARAKNSCGIFEDFLPAAPGFKSECVSNPGRIKSTANIPAQNPILFHCPKKVERPTFVQTGVHPQPVVSLEPLEAAGAKGALRSRFTPLFAKVDFSRSHFFRVTFSGCPKKGGREKFIKKC